MHVIIRSFVLPFLALGLSEVMHAQTLTDIGAAAPAPGTNDTFQLSIKGDQTWPDGINHFTENNPPVGQTFTTEINVLNLVSVTEGSTRRILRSHIRSNRTETFPAELRNS